MEQTKVEKNKLIDIFILILVYLGCASFPFNLIFGNNIEVNMGCSTALLTLFLIGMSIYLRFNKNLKITRKEINIKYLLLLLPCLLVTVSNYFYGLTIKLEFVYEPIFILNIVQTVIVVSCEEMLFRGLLQANIKCKNSLNKILITAGIFGFCHINRFLSSFNPIDLLAVLYAFGIGVILGFIYEYSGSLNACVIFHLLFNILNQVFFNQLTTKITNINYLTYVLINGGIALVVSIYLLIVYLITFRKK